MKVGSRCDAASRYGVVRFSSFQLTVSSAQFNSSLLKAAHTRATVVPGFGSMLSYEEAQMNDFLVVATEKLFSCPRQLVCDVGDCFNP